MSQIAASHMHGHDAHGHEEAHIAARKQLDVNTVTLAPGAGRLVSTTCFFVGLVGLVATVIGAFGTPASLRQSTPSGDGGVGCAAADPNATISAMRASDHSIATSRRLQRDAHPDRDRERFAVVLARGGRSHQEA